jgi:hypothetical protein
MSGEPVPQSAASGPDQNWSGLVEVARLAVLNAPESEARQVALAVLSEPVEQDGSRACP